MTGRSFLLATALLAAYAGPASAQTLNFTYQGPPSPIGSLRFLGATTVPSDLPVGDSVGGLSGIDYDPRSGMWVFVSDDKSEHLPARFYSGVIELTGAAPKVTLSRMTSFQQEDGTNYPGAKIGGEVVDPESIRFDPTGRAVWWTSEGDRKLGLSPFLRKSDINGRHLASFPVPSMFTVQKGEEVGPRHNNGFEGFSFTPAGDSLWLATESALLQDGPAATVGAGAVARFTKFDRDGKLLAQYAYPLDPIQAKTAGPGSDNGVSEILALDDNRLLVVERSGVNDGNNHWTSHIRLYEADEAGASDVADMNGLVGAAYRPLTKRLILNLDTLPELGSSRLPKIDNIEGMSFGPILPNGHRSLVLISDNNFNPDQITQFLAFEVVP